MGKIVSIKSVEQFIGIVTPYFLHILAYILAWILNPLTIFILILLVAIYFVVKFLLIKKFADEPFIIFEILPLQTTEQSPFSSSQLFNSIHGLSKVNSYLYRLFNIKREYAFEIASTKVDGIRYFVRVPAEDSSIFNKIFLSYLPGTQIKEVNDYILKDNTFSDVIEFRLSNHFAFPLRKQSKLEEYDPIAYITGSMTKLNKDEMVVFQVLTSPVKKSEIKDIKKISNLIYSNKDLVSSLKNIHFQNHTGSFLKFIILNLLRVLTLPVGLFIFVVTEGRDGPFLTFPDDSVQKKTNNPYQEELEQRVKEKLDQELFNVTLRLYVKGNNPQETNRIAKGFISVISSYGNSGYQSLIAKKILSVPKIPELLNRTFSKRLSLLPGSVILSTSEVADLYHFPYTSTTKTENIVKLMSRELPTPLSLKNDDNLDVVFGKNTYGGSEVDIGLTDDDRSRHLYLIGQTGSGKSTVIFHMASDDIKKGSGVAVIDPHGDLAEDLLSVVPLVRMNDLIYFNPFDIKYPIGINLLELVPGLDEDAVEQEKELVCESVVSVFRKIFSKDESTDAHRIEYILRNTIYTAFSVPDATIFTVYDLLENPDFQKQVIKNLEDENLKNFWKNEFGRAGNYQIVKMVSGVTAKIGRFLFSPTAKRILEQPHSTINFDEILDRKKILICNLAEGKLGEDTSRLLGTMIIAKIQQAVLRRARIQKDQRQPFYLFIDEFQNYATSSFSKLLSGGRKFGLRFTIAEQSTAQQEDRNITNVILANTGTIICFRTASPIDEELMLNQFAPYVNKSDIINLPRFKFYIKLSALTPEEPFSGETLPIVIKKDQTKTDKLIEASRKNYATLYQKPKIKKPVTEVKKDGVKGDIKKKADVDSLT